MRPMPSVNGGGGSGGGVGGVNGSRHHGSRALLSQSLPTAQLQRLLHDAEGRNAADNINIDSEFYGNYEDMVPVSRQFPKTVSFDAFKPSFAESSSSATESATELDVLKAIITREGYLTRLIGVAETVKRKFKPELPDMIDFVRAASLDVVLAIAKWREAKVCRYDIPAPNCYPIFLQHQQDAVFMWNGCNYLLKMATDLDFLAEYRAIRKWMGFNLTRNPFCVPCPLEEGMDIFAGNHNDGELDVCGYCRFVVLDAKAVDPKYIEQGRSIDGFAVGGQTPSKFALGVHPAEELTVTAPPAPKTFRKVVDPDQEPYGTVGSTIKKARTRIEGVYGIKKAIQEKNDRPVESFILNSDMVSIRNAEQIILQEESKFGRMERSAVLAGGLSAMQEAMEEIETIKQWEQEQAQSRPFSRQSKNNRSQTESLSGLDLFPLKASAGTTSHSPQMSPMELAPDAAPTPTNSSQARRPVNPSNPMTGARPVGSVVKYQKKRSLGERLAEIARLRSELEAEKVALDNEQRNFSMDKSGIKKTSSSDGARRGRHIHSASASTLKSVDRAVLESVGDHESTTAQQLNPSPHTSMGDLLPSGTPSRTGDVSDISATKDPHVHFDANSNDQLSPVSAAHVSAGIRSWDDIMHDEGLDEPLHSAHHHTHGEAELISEAEELQEERLRLREWRLQIVALGKRKGRIPPPELFEVLDYFAVLVTRMVVGYAKKKWTKKNRVACIQSKILIQARMRGFLVRNRNWIAKKRQNAANDIQRCLRGYKSRVSVSCRFFLPLPA
jgi:hypothetical protein